MEHGGDAQTDGMDDMDRGITEVMKTANDSVADTEDTLNTHQDLNVYTTNASNGSVISSAVQSDHVHIEATSDAATSSPLLVERIPSSSSNTTLPPQSTSSTLLEIANIMKDGFAQLRDDMKSFQERLLTLEQAKGQEERVPGNNRRRNRRGAKGKGKTSQDPTDWTSVPLGVKLSDDEDQLAEDSVQNINNEGALSNIPGKESRFAQLPPETLNKVLKYAAQACRAKFNGADEHGWTASDDASWNALDGPKKEKTELPKDEKEVQCWLLYLRRVCKAWDPIIRTFVFQDIFIANEQMIDRMTVLMSERPEFVELMNEKVLINTIALATKKQKRLHQHHTSAWHEAMDGDHDTDGEEEEGPGPQHHHCPKCCSALAAAGQDDGTVSPEVKVSRFLEKATKLQHLELQLDGRSSPHLRIPFAKFLDKTLLNTLASSQLRSLQFEDQIMFTDLEKIMLGLRSLQNLRLEGGVDSPDKLDEVSSRDHTAALRSLVIENMYGNSLGHLQFQWLLRPAAGSLEELDIELASYIAPVIQQGANDDSDEDDDDDLPGASHPFAAAAFANLLVQFAPTLRILKLLAVDKGPVLISPDLQAEPHLGNLDHALSHCTILQVVEMKWTLVGNGFLEYLSRSPTLREITMHGISTQTTAAGLVNHLRQNSFPSLRKIQLLGYRRQTGVPGWSTKQLRELVDLSADMHIKLNISTSGHATA